MKAIPSFFFELQFINTMYLHSAPPNMNQSITELFTWPALISLIFMCPFDVLVLWGGCLGVCYQSSGMSVKMLNIEYLYDEMIRKVMNWYLLSGMDLTVTGMICINSHYRLMHSWMLLFLQIHLFFVMFSLRGHSSQLLSRSGFYHLSFIKLTRDTLGISFRPGTKQTVPKPPSSTMVKISLLC